MALLGNVSAEMSMCATGACWTTTIREEYERALTLAKKRAGIPVGPRRTG